MLNGIGVFDLTSARLSYETAGLRVVANNIANADTPGFRGRAVVPFAEVLRDAGRAADVSIRTEAARVLEGDVAGASAQVEEGRGGCRGRHHVELQAGKGRRHLHQDEQPEEAAEAVGCGKA